MSMERRNSPRIPLDTPCLLGLVANYGDKHPVMAVDVSQGGVQLALSPGMDEKAIMPDMPVTLEDVPPPLDRLLEGAHGKIAWVGQRCCGIRLNKHLPLDASDVTDIARL